MRRVFRRHRNPHKQDEAQKDQPFFPKAHAREQKPFFPGPAPQAPVQTKLAIGQPGDKYENEADAVAARVVNGTDPASVQSQGISSIQRIATPEEDKGLSTAEQRMEKDRAIQEQSKSGAQSAMPAKEKEEKPIQKAAPPAKATGEKEEKKPIQTQTAPTTTKKDEEKKVQKKASPGGSSLLQRNSGPKAATASNPLSSRIENSSGKGSPLPNKTRAEMEAAFGRDFSNVNVHADQSAAEMNEQLGAHAFTHGQDVYFNSGQYQPEAAQGKRLLAHELTHVVQQRGPGLVSTERSKDDSKTVASTFDGSVKARDALAAAGSCWDCGNLGNETLSQFVLEMNNGRVPNTGSIFQARDCSFEVIASNPATGPTQIKILKHK